jgi:hypothetical protein
MTDLMELASRVEAREGPDRELDALICLAIGQSGGNPIVAPGMAGWLVGSQTNPNPVEAKRYTASLDAAMSLVPPNCYPWVEFGKNKGVAESRRWYAHIAAPDDWDRQRVEDEWHCDVYAATPALALTAAALRARAHQGTAHVDQ